jgi:serine/threonine protein kinase
MAKKEEIDLEEESAIVLKQADSSLQAESAAPANEQKPAGDSEYHANPMIGKVIAGKFEIISFLGAGGMSIVYKARHLQLGKIYALKILQTERLQVQKDIHRFQKEAQAATSLNHPNIVSVREYGIDDDSHPYIAMDFVEGETLAEIIKRGPLPPERAMFIAAEVCKGLAHAHEHGIIHRDIKPENIVITKGADNLEKPMILDFGIAKLQTDDPNRTRLTQTGEVFGTPAYMSPEQALGFPVERQSDIYALGCVFYEMLAGTHPFHSDNPLALLMKHLSEAPPPLNDVPAEIQSIVMKAMEKDPLARFSNASEMQVAISNVASNKQLIQMPEFSYAKTLVLRAFAWVIDLAIITVPSFALASVLPNGLLSSANRALSLNGLAEQTMPAFGIINIINNDAPVYMVGIGLFSCLAIYLYHALLESSRFQGTIGKQVLGLICTNNSFGRLSFREASYRYWAKTIYCAIYLLLAVLVQKYLMVKEWAPMALATFSILALAAFLLRKRYQMIHDLISCAKVIPSRYAASSATGKSAPKPLTFGSKSWRTAVTIACTGLVALAVQLNLDKLHASQKLEYLSWASRVETIPEAQQVYILATDPNSGLTIPKAELGAALLKAGDNLVAKQRGTEAEKVYELAYKLSDLPKDGAERLKIALYLTHASGRYRLQGLFTPSEQFGLRGLAVLKLMSPSDRKAAPGYEDLLYDNMTALAWAYSDSMQGNKVIQMCDAVLALDSVKTNELKKSMALLDYGVLGERNGRFKSAKGYFEKALAAAGSAKSDFWRGISLAMIANCYNFEQDLPKAHELCVQARDLMCRTPSEDLTWYHKYYFKFANDILEDNKVRRAENSRIPDSPAPNKN